MYLELAAVAIAVVGVIALARHLAQTPYTIPTVHLAFSDPLPRHTTQGALHQAYLSATVKSATKGFWGLQPSQVADKKLGKIQSPDLQSLLDRAFPPEIQDHPIVLGIELITIDNGLMHMVRPRFEFRDGYAVGVELSLRSVIVTECAEVH